MGGGYGPQGGSMGGGMGAGPAKRRRFAGEGGGRGGAGDSAGRGGRGGAGPMRKPQVQRRPADGMDTDMREVKDKQLSSQSRQAVSGTVGPAGLAKLPSGLTTKQQYQHVAATGERRFFDQVSSSSTAPLLKFPT